MLVYTLSLIFKLPKNGTEKLRLMQLLLLLLYSANTLSIFSTINSEFVVNAILSTTDNNTT